MYRVKSRTNFRVYNYKKCWDKKTFFNISYEHSNLHVEILSKKNPFSVAVRVKGVIINGPYSHKYTKIFINAHLQKIKKTFQL